MTQPLREEDVLYRFVPNGEDAKWSACLAEKYVVLNSVFSYALWGLYGGTWEKADWQWRFALRCLLRERAALIAKEADLRQKVIASHEEICQTLGQALGYLWFKDDQKNFPGATEEHGVCVGDQVAETLARQAAERIRELELKSKKRKVNEEKNMRKLGIEIIPGDTIDFACGEAVRIARATGYVVAFNFNGQHFLATPESDPQAMAKEYEEESNRLHAAYLASPEYRRDQEERAKNSK